MFQEAYITDASNSPAKFSGWLDNIFANIQTGQQVTQGGLNIYAQIQQMLNSGGASGGAGPAKGLQAITQRTNQILASLQQLRATIGQQPYEQLYQAAQRLVAALSDPSVIYQAKSGKDAAVLANAKTQANQILQEIVSHAGSVSGNLTNQAGQVITSGGNVVSTGFDTLANNPWLYVAGGGLVAYLLLKKK